MDLHLLVVERDKNNHKKKIRWHKQKGNEQMVIETNEARLTRGNWKSKTKLVIQFQEWEKHENMKYQKGINRISERRIQKVVFLLFEQMNKA